MAEVEAMTVELSEPVAATVHAAVATGEYASASDVVRDALGLWRDHRDAFGNVIALRRAWDEGKASGIAGSLDIEAIISEARAEADIG